MRSNLGQTACSTRAFKRGLIPIPARHRPSLLYKSVRLLGKAIILCHYVSSFLASLESSLLQKIAIGIAATRNPRITVFEENSGVVGVWEGLAFGVGENVRLIVADGVDAELTL